MSRYILFTIFFFIGILIFLAMHGLLFYVLTHLVAVSKKYKQFLGIGLAILAPSFIVTSVLLHYWDTFITRWAYFVSGWWLGFMWYFILLALIGLVLISIFHWQNSFIIRGSIFALVVIISFAITIWGGWNGRNPIIRRIVLPADSFNSSWKGKTLVQISDLHLGAVYGVDYLNETVDRINKLKPDYIVITGDYFDGAGGDLPHLSLPLNRLNAPTYYITGNHEVYLGEKLTHNLIGQTKTMSLKNKAVDLDGVLLIGIDYPENSRNINLPDMIKTVNPEKKPAILLYHEPRQVSAVAQTGVRLMLSGHTHNGQVWPFNIFTTLIYGKYSLGLNKTDSMYSYTSSGLGTWGPSLRTSSRSEIVQFKFE